MAYAVTAACARGNISSCGCAPDPKGPREAAAPSGWKWGGCSVDIGYGMRFARRFLDARELEGDERSLMNLHNNKAGRKVRCRVLSYVIFKIIEVVTYYLYCNKPYFTRDMGLKLPSRDYSL